MNIFVHRARGAAMLRATESSGFKNGCSKLADTGFVVEFATCVDRAALHVFARKFAGKAYMLPFEKEKCQGLAGRERHSFSLGTWGAVFKKYYGAGTK